MKTTILRPSWWITRAGYFGILLVFVILSACSGSSTSLPAKPTNLAYLTNPATYTAGTLIASNTPSSSGTVASYSVSPALPTGLSLNTTTGVITGTPASATSLAPYAITASNAGGNTTAILTVTINPSAVAVNTTAATMDPGSQRIFSATVTGLPSSAVTWSTVPAGTGTVTVLDADNVAYTAPATGGQIRLIATSVSDGSATATITIHVSAVAAQTENVFNNWNVGGVSNGPTSPTTFSITTTRHIVYFDTYHYFNGGVLPGLLSLKHSDGTVYGPWQTTGSLGQGGVLNASWICYPDMDIKAGTYTVIDSDPSTWSYDSESSGEGFSHIMALTL